MDKKTETVSIQGCSGKTTNIIILDSLYNSGISIRYSTLLRPDNYIAYFSGFVLDQPSRWNRLF